MMFTGRLYLHILFIYALAIQNWFSSFYAMSGATCKKNKKIGFITISTNTHTYIRNLCCYLK